MEISNDEIKKALKIKNAVQYYLDMTKEVNIRSTDVFPYLVRKGIFVQDKNNGLFFRRFLKRLYKANMLKSLIPQCTYVPGINGEIFGEWYFNINSSRSPTKNAECSEAKNDEPIIITIEDARKTLYDLIEGRNPDTGKLIDRLEDPNLYKISQALKIFTEIEDNVDEFKNKPVKDIQSRSNRDKTLNSLQVDPEVENNPVYSVDKIRKSHENAYKPWTSEEETHLTELFEQGFTIKEIARKMKRQNGGIKSRLRKLGLKVK
ncbi:hypothetical protein [uncultured Christiangramia sp.]|uniref:hypothetical protein n=1 Tax=uncultured Christiangramia sp. TaxID=503836 RepID=UPI00261F46FE|nr:hypothetical protein [uncultured Christiangramia sp.]